MKSSSSQCLLLPMTRVCSEGLGIQPRSFSPQTKCGDLDGENIVTGTLDENRNLFPAAFIQYRYFFKSRQARSCLFNIDYVYLKLPGTTTTTVVSEIVWWDITPGFEISKTK